MPWNDQTRRTADGRRHPRIPVECSIEIRDLTAALAMEIQNVSFGGFRTLSPMAIDPGARHIFQVALPRDGHLPMQANAVYCRLVNSAHKTYAVGWAITDDLVTVRSVARLIDYVTDAASFDSAPSTIRPS